MPGCGSLQQKCIRSGKPADGCWFPPDRLGAALSHHQVVQQQGGQKHNEVIIDKWHSPWEPDLKDMIEAVFISPWASSEAEAYGRAVQRALVQLLGVDSVMLPLVTYDHTATSDPFQLA